MAAEKYPLNPILTPLDRDERLQILENWQRITRYFNSVEGQIKLLAGGKEIEELLQSIESAITNAQDVTTNAQTALDNVTNALLQLNTVISNANAATNRANDAADDANTLNIALTSLKGHLETLQNDLTGIVQDETQRVTNEGDRVQAEDERADAESLRISAEGVREQAEIVRGDAEDLREQNETVRKNAETERDNAEQLRIDEEVERIANENSRISAEVDRIDVEQERVGAEIIREQNEVERVGNEDIRGNKENARLQAEVERIENEVIREQNEQLREAAYTLLSELLQNMESLAYDYAETYKFPNFVSYNGSTFMALKEVQGITPINDGVNYRLVAQRGVDGTGAVSSVNGWSPDPNGNVNLIINYINNLTSDRIDEGLSAAAGKLLMTLITTLQNDKANITYVNEHVEFEVARLVNEAPETLNTINALAQALGEDPNFAVTIMAMLGEKATNADLTTLSTAVATHLDQSEKTYADNLSRATNLVGDQIIAVGFKPKLVILYGFLESVANANYSSIGSISRTGNIQARIFSYASGGRYTSTGAILELHSGSGFNLATCKINEDNTITLSWSKGGADIPNDTIKMHIIAM